MNHDAVETAYRRWFPVIREKCRRMLRDPELAGDVAQETFLRLWTKGPREAEPGQVVSWIYRTSTRLALDHLRRRARTERLDLPRRDGPDAERTLVSRQSLNLLARRVPRGELELALLHRIDELTLDEVAEVAGISERTVRRRLARLDARLERLTKELGR